MPVETTIPEKYYLYSDTPIYHPQSGETKIEYTNDQLLWERRLFPAHLPKGRDQVIMLSQTLGLMLKQSHKSMCGLLTDINNNNNKERMDEFICDFNFDDILMNEYNIWDIVLHEVARQVFILLLLIIN